MLRGIRIFFKHAIAVALTLCTQLPSSPQLTLFCSIVNLLASEVASDYFQVTQGSCLPFFTFCPVLDLACASHSPFSPPFFFPQPAASTDTSLSSTTAPYARSAAPAPAVASAASSGTGLLQPPHAQSRDSTVWSPLHSNANVGAGLFQVFSSAPNEAAALPGQSTPR